MINDDNNSENKNNQENNIFSSIVNDLEEILNYANENLIAKQKK